MLVEIHESVSAFVGSRVVSSDVKVLIEISACDAVGVENDGFVAEIGDVAEQVPVPICETAGTVVAGISERKCGENVVQDD